MSKVGKDINKMMADLLSDINEAQTYLFSGAGDPEDKEQLQEEIDDMYSQLHNLKARPK